MPKVSIIVPVYNTEKYLRTCLDSILAQTFADFEAILVDDGSTDKSGDICDEFAARDKRIVVIHKQNGGVAKARITAFECSKGDYITFIDADDYVDERYVGHLYECIERNNADVSCCQYYKVDENGKHLSTRKNFGYFERTGIEKVIIPGTSWDRKLRKESVAHVLWAKMIKRCYVKEILEAGEGLWYGEDQCGVLRMLYLINSFYHSETPLYYYVFHDGQATAIMDRKRWDAYEAYWRRMISEDIKGLYSPLMPYRIFEHLNRFINYWFLKASSYQEFKKEAMYSLKSSFLDDHLFNKELEGLSKKEKFYFFLLKNKFTFIYYYIRKIRSYIR